MEVPTASAPVSVSRGGVHAPIPGHRRHGGPRMTSPLGRSRDGRVFRLRRRPHKIAFTAHVLAAVGWFGIAIAVAFCAIASALTNDEALSRALYRTLETLPWLSIPVGITAVGTGSVLGLGTTFGLVRYWWVVAKIVIAVAVIVTDALIVVAVAHDAVVTGQAQPPLYGSTIAHVVVLGAATVLSVFKPWGRTPWASRERRAGPG